MPESTRPEVYTLTRQDITAYVATKQPEETVGYTRIMRSCLIAESLLWKYRDLVEAEVNHDNRFATIETKTGASTTVTFPATVKDAADRFDRLGGIGQAITRQQLESGIPELFA